MRAPIFILVAAFAACEPPQPTGEGEGEGEGEAEGGGVGGTIVVAPVACDFGRVVGTAACTLDIANVGTRDLIVDRTEILDADGAPEPASTFFLPVNVGVIAPGASVAVGVRFRPVVGTEEVEVVGFLRIRSNDVVTPALDVPLSGIAALPPQCTVRVASVNGIDVAAGADVPTIARFDGNVDNQCP